jgi:glutamate-5-semialdehyde dehydrogenase
MYVIFFHQGGRIRNLFCSKPGFLPAVDPCYCRCMSDWKMLAENTGKSARKAAMQLAATSGAARAAALRAIASSIENHSDAICRANAIDVEQAQHSLLAPAMIERLKLDPKKIAKMAQSVRDIADQPEPVGQITDTHLRPDGLKIEKLRVPLGVVLFFYESRPNVTSDAAALCLKSGNAVILRGGKESLQSNLAIAKAIAEGLTSAGIDPAAVQLIESTDRALVPQLLRLDRYIDLVIPRGGESLIRAVVAESTIPVLKHYTGNCHVYVDAATESMEQKVRDVCVNAKTSYPGGGVCNAAEKIIFHRAAAERLLTKVCGDLADRNVEIRGDGATQSLYPKAIPATEEDWFTEYLSFTIAVKVVDSLQQAIDHINHYGSHHTDAILSTDANAIEEFVKKVDSASVMINASTRFADGGEYGLGAEIGISTDKLHARGPMGAMDLTTYKWVVTGDGHVRV